MKLTASFLLSLLVSALVLSAEPFVPADVPDPFEDEPVKPSADPVPGFDPVKSDPPATPGAPETDFRQPGDAVQHARSFGPEQLTGEPDTPNAGDYSTCWAAATSNGGKQWLELSYGKRVQPLSVWVYENYNPGSVFQVTGLIGDKEIKLWRGVDPVARTEARGIAKIPIDTEKKFDRIRVYLDCKAVSGWNEIDAVGVLDQDENLQWAISARTTTSYAGTDVIPFLDPFQPPREAFEEKFASIETQIQQNTQAMQALKSALDTRRNSLKQLRAELNSLKRDYAKLLQAEKPRRKRARDDGA